MVDNLDSEVDRSALRFTIDKRYPVLLLDPPWHYYGSKPFNGIPGEGGHPCEQGMGKAAKFYPTMTDEQIAALPVRDWLEPKHVVFLWATGPRLDSAIDTLRAWGLFYRGLAWCWVKTRKDGQPIAAQGVRPSVVKPTTEFVLIGSTKAKGRPLPIADEGVPQVILAPRRAHSQKPDAVQERIDRLFPNLRKAELFARRHRAGWDCYGEFSP